MTIHIFMVLIQASIHEKAEKKDLGSLFESNSTISIVWATIDKKLKKATFRKVDLNTIIPDYNRRTIPR